MGMKRMGRFCEAGECLLHGELCCDTRNEHLCKISFARIYFIDSNKENGEIWTHAQNQTVKCPYKDALCVMECFRCPAYKEFHKKGSEDLPEFAICMRLLAELSPLWKN